ncbi:MAG: methyltransferase domain-containing protein [Phycisphaerales bacterium]|nr:methyltransferase domain-containing protein [Phycisphaerales bacterium]
MSGSGLKRGVRQALARLMRPGVAPIEAKLDMVIASLDAKLDGNLPANLDTGRGEIAGAVWRGGCSGCAVRPDGSVDPGATRRMRQELQYWVRASANLDGEFEVSLAETFGRWQRIRLYELARCMDMHGGLEVGAPMRGAMAAWLREQRAVEIGGGPWPCVAAGDFASAFVVDPLADGYRAEGLVAPEAAGVTYLAAVGEAIPLTTGSVDLVITDNCLDHVQDPAQVAREMARILRPSGLLWLLVDVMDQADELHPHPMSEGAATGLLRAAGLEQRWGEVWDGHSHPRAKGQWRTLWVKPG